MRRVLLIAVLLAGCTQKTRLARVEGGIQAPDGEVRFGVTYRGFPRNKKLVLRNTAPTARKVTFTLDGPFYIDTFSAEIPGAAEGGGTLTFQPDFLGKAEGTLTVQTEDHTWTVQLTGEGADAPICGRGTACVPEHFDPDLGKCVTEHLPDGTACPDNCLDGPHCEGGQCVGSPKSCDDANVCTADRCDPAVGCVHDDLTSNCPAPPDNCHAAFCDAQVGCGIMEVPDETLCGPADCKTKQACHAGACVTEPTEDGFQCAPGSPCQLMGRCFQHVCVQPKVQPLAPAWTVPLDVKSQATVAGLVQDERGMAYLSWSSNDEGGLAQVDPAGNVTFLQRGVSQPAQVLTATSAGLFAMKGGRLAAIDLRGAPRFTTEVTDAVQLAVQDDLALVSRIAPGPQPWTPDAPALFIADGGIDWLLPGAHTPGHTCTEPTCGGGQAMLSRAIADGQGRFFVASHGAGGDWLRALDENGQELWRVASSGDPALVLNGLVLATDGVARSTDDGHMLFDTGAPVETSAGDPVSDGQWLWIPRGDGTGLVTGLDVWDLGTGTKVGGVADASRFSGLRQLVATARGTVVAEDGQSLVEIDSNANVVWSCPTVGAPLYSIGPSGRPPQPLLQSGSFVRVAELPAGSPKPVGPSSTVSNRYVIQGFSLPGLEPADKGWVMGNGNPARTARPK